MGFNFRKSFKIAPGVRLNVTKNGISSVSVGSKGAKVNIGKIWKSDKKDLGAMNSKTYAIIEAKASLSMGKGTTRFFIE